MDFGFNWPFLKNHIKADTSITNFLVPKSELKNLKGQNKKQNFFMS